MKDRKIYFYKLTVDAGTAPCVDDNLLSLAICKPMLRRTAGEGDIIIGFAGNELDRNNRLIYAAEVTIRLEDGAYFRDRKYSHRKDCIYEWNDNAYKIKKNVNFHSTQKDLERDLGKAPVYKRANVLLSKKFNYYGCGPTLDYSEVIHKAVTTLKRGHRISHSASLRKELEKLIEKEKLRSASVLGKPHHSATHAIPRNDDNCGVVCSPCPPPPTGHQKTRARE